MRRCAALSAVSPAEGVALAVRFPNPSIMPLSEIPNGHPVVVRTVAIAEAAQTRHLEALGILPGTGPVAAVFLAVIFRVNRAASLMASLATNTWLSFVTFVISIKAGAWIFGLDWVKVYGRTTALIKQFRWLDMFRQSFLELVLPLFTGYILVALGLGIGVYLVTLAAFKLCKQGSQKPA